MAENVTLANLANLQNETTAVGNINANNATITTAFADVLSRTGVTPNTMQANLDMNSNRIVNLAAPVGANDAARKADVDASASASATASAAQAASSAAGAATSASSASASATAAAASAGASQANAIADVYSFDSSTSTGTSPATGGMRFNNATIGSVTQIAMNNLTAASGNPDIHTFIDHWADSTNTTKGYLEIRKVGATQNFVVFTVTGTTSQSGYRQIAVTTTSSGGTTFNAADSLAVVFTRTGDTGAAGSGVTAGGPNLIALYTASATISAGVVQGSSNQALIQSSNAVPTWTANPSYTNLTLTGSAAVTGNISAASVNLITLTKPATGSTLTIADGKTVSFTNTIAFSSIADTVSLNVGSGGTITTTSSAGILYDNIPQTSTGAGSYTAGLGDAEKHIIHPNSDNSARTVTIPSAGSVAYALGTAITIINEPGATNVSALTISSTGADIIYLAGQANVGSAGLARSLAVGGIATMLKTTSGPPAKWIISGTGIS